MNPNQPRRSPGLFIMILLVLSVVFYAIALGGNRNSKEVYLSEFVDCLEKNIVTDVTIKQNTDDQINSLIEQNMQSDEVQ